MLLLWVLYLFCACFGSFAVSQWNQRRKWIANIFHCCIRISENLFIANDIFGKRVWIAAISLARLRLVSAHVGTLKDKYYLWKRKCRKIDGTQRGNKTKPVPRQRQQHCPLCYAFFVLLRSIQFLVWSIFCVWVENSLCKPLSGMDIKCGVRCNRSNPNLLNDVNFESVSSSKSNCT